jgi:hypothetical protein
MESILDRGPRLSPLHPVNKLEMLESISDNWTSIYRASIIIKGDWDFMISAVQVDYRTMEFAAVSLKHDPGFCIEAARQDVRALAHAPLSVLSDVNTMLVITSSTPASSGLRYASISLLGNGGFMMNATRINYRSLEFALNNLKESRAFMLSVALQSPMAFQFACSTLRSDAAYMLQVAQANHVAAQFAAPHLLADLPFILSVIGKAGARVLRHVPRSMRESEHSMLEAIRLDFRAVHFAALSLRRSDKFLHDAFGANMKIGLVANHVRANANKGRVIVVIE